MSGGISQRVNWLVPRRGSVRSAGYGAEGCGVFCAPAVESLQCCRDRWHAGFHGCSSGFTSRGVASAMISVTATWPNCSPDVQIWNRPKIPWTAAFVAPSSVIPLPLTPAWPGNQGNVVLTVCKSERTARARFQCEWVGELWGLGTGDSEPRTAFRESAPQELPWRKVTCIVEFLT
jgi:hypothetical protein